MGSSGDTCEHLSVIFFFFFGCIEKASSSNRHHRSCSVLLIKWCQSGRLKHRFSPLNYLSSYCRPTQPPPTPTDPSAALVYRAYICPPRSSAAEAHKLRTKSPANTHSRQIIYDYYLLCLEQELLSIWFSGHLEVEWIQEMATLHLGGWRRCWPGNCRECSQYGDNFIG